MATKDLMEKRGKLVTEARAALEEIKANTDESRAAELDKRHDDIMKEFDKLDADIAREKRVEDAERRQREAEDEARDKRRPNPGGSENRNDDEPSLEYRDVFHRFIKAGGDLGDMSSEERAILRQGALAGGETRAQTAGTAAAGGFLVPTELANMIVKSMKAWGPMYDGDITTVFETASGNPIKIPAVDDTSVTAGAHAEGAALTDDGGKDVVLSQKSLDSYVFDTEFVRFSMELAQDSALNVETLLSELLGERLGRIANAQLTTGTGASAPNGVVTASTLGRTATAAAAITSDEIIDLLHSVDPAYRQSPKVRFMFADTTLAAIRKLKDTTGSYIWQMGDITKGAPGTILGYRYEVNQAVPSIATGNRVMLFGDFGKYFVRKVGGPAIGVLRERFWPDLGIAGLIRFDGELGDTAAIKHLIMA